MRRVRKILLVVVLAQVAWSLPLTVVMGILWLHNAGQPNVSYPCGGGRTCTHGPIVYLILTLAFGFVAAVCGTISVVLVVRWRRRAALRAHLLSTGVQVPAVLVEVAPTGTVVNGRRIHMLVFEANPDGRVVRARERSVLVPPLGARATIAYDPAIPTRAVLVEEVEKLPPPEPGLSAMRDALAANLEVALAELRRKVDRGELTEADYQAQREQWMRLLETPTNH